MNTARNAQQLSKSFHESGRAAGRAKTFLGFSPLGRAGRPFTAGARLGHFEVTQ